MTIHLEGLAPLLAQLTNLAQLRRVARKMKAAAVHVKGKISHYPSPRHGPQPFVSDRQRRGFFYHLKHGDIEVPYIRGGRNSQRLGASWTTTSRDSGLTQIIGTNVGYAKLVQGPGEQTRYHATTGWPTTDDVITREQSTVVEYIRQGILEEIDG